MQKERKPGLSPIEALVSFLFSLLLPVVILSIKIMHDDVPYPTATYGGFGIGLALVALSLLWQVRRRKKSEKS